MNWELRMIPARVSPLLRGSSGTESGIYTSGGYAGVVITYGRKNTGSAKERLHSICRIMKY